MVWFRVVFGLLLLASAYCFVRYLVSRDAVWRHRGLLILKWTVFAGLGFFAGIFIERMITGP
jgi:hypothetical protein